MYSKTNLINLRHVQGVVQVEYIYVQFVYHFKQTMPIVTVMITYKVLQACDAFSRKKNKNAMEKKYPLLFFKYQHLV